MFPGVSYKQCDIGNGFRTDKLSEIIGIENIEKNIYYNLEYKELNYSYLYYCGGRICKRNII